MVVILLGGRLVCIEDLDTLKKTTREVAVTLADATTPPPQVPGEVLAHVPMGHEHVWMVRNLDEERLQEMCAQATPIPCEVRQPNLEEILLALLREYRRPAVRGEAREQSRELRVGS
jgi:hypothetical protein